MRAKSTSLDCDHDEVVSKSQGICLLKMYLGIYQQPSLDSELCEPRSLSEMIDSLDIDWREMFDIAVSEGLYELDNVWDVLRNTGEGDALVDHAIAKRLAWDGVRDTGRREHRYAPLDPGIPVHDWLHDSSRSPIITGFY